MRTVVFLGPSLPRSEAEILLDAVYLPPASRGDIYSAAQSRPWAIGLIDGFFHQVPSVLHKEILWAMSRGIHVYGAASMGALRAAELAPFGMVGVGRVFEDFRDGTLTDDDEVAVVHGPPGTGYLLASEAMVNIRGTLARATSERVIDEAGQSALIAMAKSLFYPERSWERLLREAATQSALTESCRRLAAWLPAGRVDVKREDAVAMLRQIAEDYRRSPEPKRIEWRFHSTTVWEQHCNSFEGLAQEAVVGGEELQGDEILDELRLQGEAYEAERERAFSRVLASQLALRQGQTLDPASTDQLLLAARRARGLGDDRSLEHWLQRNGVSREDFAGLVHDEAAVRSIRERYRSWIPRYLHDSLRLDGSYVALESRAREKQRLLSRWGLSSPSLADAGMTEPELWEWYFLELLRQPVPPDLDSYAESRDYAEVDLMRRAALRELLYRRKSALAMQSVPNLVPHA